MNKDKKKISFDIKLEMYAILKKLAKDNDTSITHILKQAVRDLIQKLKLNNDK